MVLAFTAQFTQLFRRAERFDHTILVLAALRSRLGTLAPRRSTRALASDGNVVAHALVARDTGTVRAAEILFARAVLMLRTFRVAEDSAEREGNKQCETALARHLMLKMITH